MVVSGGRRSVRKGVAVIASPRVRQGESLPRLSEAGSKATGGALGVMAGEGPKEKAQRRRPKGGGPEADIRRRSVARGPDTNGTGASACTCLNLREIFSLLPTARMVRAILIGPAHQSPANHAMGAGGLPA
jgi:hypothetical protein